MSFCLECGPRIQEEASPKRAPAPRALSPVSAYCLGELDPEETKNFFHLQAKNRELRWQLGLAGVTMGSSPKVGAQVEEHLARLRFAVAENARLRTDLARAKESLAASGCILQEEDLKAELNDGQSKPEKERLAEAVMADIQTVTQANIELISQYDDKVKNLEAEIVSERRRRQTAEMELRVPSSLRSLSPIRSSPELPAAALKNGRWRSEPANAIAATLSQEEGLAKKRAELRQLETDCSRLAQELEIDAAKKDARVIQELQLANDIQQEELAHFRRLVQEKRSGGGPPPLATPNTGALLEAELEQLREHLAQVQQKGDQERDAADRQAEELRREAQQFEKDMESIKLERHRCVQDVKKANSEAIAGVSFDCGQSQEAERQRSEELSKDVSRTTRRIELLDSKIDQLRKEAKDISQRANLVLRAVPDVQGGPAESADSAERVVELQELVTDREQRLAALKLKEENLRSEVARAREAQEAAQVGASVMEQKMKLLKSRLSSATHL